MNAVCHRGHGVEVSLRLIQSRFMGSAPEAHEDVTSVAPPYGGLSQAQ